MTETQQLVARIHALAEKSKRSPSTLSRELLGSGTRLSEIEAGGSLTMTVFARAQAKLAEMEQAA
jgi:hypothetical protein